MSMQDRAMVGKNSPRIQQALRRVAAGMGGGGAIVPEFMTTAQRLALPNPNDHRLVYDTDLQILFMYNGAAWQQIQFGPVPEFMTTAQRLATDPQLHRFVYDTDLAQLLMWDNLSWQQIWPGTLQVLEQTVSLGQRSGLDFGYGFEVAPAGGGATVDYPVQVTTAERLLMTPRTGTIVFDTTQSRHFGYNGVTWAEV